MMNLQSAEWRMTKWEGADVFLLLVNHFTHFSSKLSGVEGLSKHRDAHQAGLFAHA